MTFHLAPSNPLIITAAAEAQRLHLCCISGCHGKKKKKIHPTSILRRQKTIFLLEEIEGLRVKNTENQWQPLMCVCVCVCARMNLEKKNHTWIFLDASQTAAAKISVYHHNHYKQWCSCLFLLLEEYVLNRSRQMKAMFEFPATLWASGWRAKPADSLLPDIPLCLLMVSCSQRDSKRRRV